MCLEIYGYRMPLYIHVFEMHMRTVDLTLELKFLIGSSLCVCTEINDNAIAVRKVAKTKFVIALFCDVYSNNQKQLFYFF